MGNIFIWSSSLSAHRKLVDLSFACISLMVTTSKTHFTSIGFEVVMHDVRVI